MGRIFFKVSIPPISSIVSPKLQMGIKKQKIIFFSLIVNVLIIFGLELGAGYWLQNKTIYAIPGLMKDKHPFMEFDKDLGFRIRKKVFPRTLLYLKNKQKPQLSKKINKHIQQLALLHPFKFIFPFETSLKSE